MEMFDSPDPMLRTFWWIALPASIIFIIQTIMTFVGGDTFDGVDADFDGDLNDGHAPFQLFSFRNLINFLLGFSWTGISFYGLIANPVVLAVVSLLVGCLFVFLFFIIIRQVQKLAEDNSFRIQATLNKTAETYLPIPANRQGKGKVLVSVNGSMRELDAMTNDERIESGAPVKVVGIEQNAILIVEKF
ncbi:MAG: NfeD family protein [Bacteroidia bacterium]|nr:NfeD family protein [Bacteroidia bacterium]